jgi:hypothetical protein
MLRIIVILILAGLLLVVLGYAVFVFVVLPRAWQPLTLSVSFGDVNGNGSLDALVGNGHTDDTGWPNTVWLNDGTGRFTDSGQQLGEQSENSVSVALVDLDGNGSLDAVFGNDWMHTIWRNDGTGQFSRITGLSIASGNANDHGGSIGYFGGMAVGDVNGDGWPDVVAGSCCRGEWVAFDDQGEVGRGINDAYNLIFFNKGDGRFDVSPQRVGNDSTGAVALGDLNGDGYLDLFVANLRAYSEGDHRDQIWFNNGQGMFTDSGQRLGDSNSSAVALGDLDGDGDLDAYVGNTYYPRSPRDVSNDASRIDQVWLNDGSGNFTPGPQPNGLVDTRFIALADMDGDGDLDAFIASRTEAFILWNDGSGGFSELGPGFKPGRDYAYNIADVDGDGLIDVFAIHLRRGYIVWRNLGNGTFERLR